MNKADLFGNEGFKQPQNKIEAGGGKSKRDLMWEQKRI